MNIFYLDKAPVKAAEYHIDRHVVKMIQEYAQIMSTAHRMLDGRFEEVALNPAVYQNLRTMGWTGKISHSARLLPGESIKLQIEMFDKLDQVKWVIENKQAMAMTHVNHPCAIWARQSVENYMWLYNLFVCLCDEKRHRYPKGPNVTWTQYGKFLSFPPKKLTATNTAGFQTPALAMPAMYKTDDPVQAYRRYYAGDKFRIAKWTNRSIPSWFFKTMPQAWEHDGEAKLRDLMDPKVAKRTQITVNHVKKYVPDVYNQVNL